MLSRGWICFTCRWLLRGGHSRAILVGLPTPSATGYSGLTNPKILRLCSPGFSTNSTHIISAFTPPSDRHTHYLGQKKCTAQHNRPAGPSSTPLIRRHLFCSPCHSPSAFLPRRQGPRELGRAVCLGHNRSRLPVVEHTALMRHVLPAMFPVLSTVRFDFEA